MAPDKDRDADEKTPAQSPAGDHFEHTVVDARALSDNEPTKDPNAQPQEGLEPEASQPTTPEEPAEKTKSLGPVPEVSAEALTNILGTPPPTDVEQFLPLAALGSSPSQNEATVEEDAWAELDNDNKDWRSVTGESAVDYKPAAAALDDSRKHTNIFALGKEVDPAVGSRLVPLNPESAPEFGLIKRELLVGRSAGCDIVIQHGSVSREHARLTRDGESYVLVDQRSSNGVFVNGERIKKKALKSGDIVSFGKVAFRFHALGDAASPPPTGESRAEAPDISEPYRDSPVYLRWYFVLGAIVLLCTSFIAAGVWVKKRKEAQTKNQETAFLYYLAGVQAFKNRDWSGAEVQFTIFQSLAPESPRAPRYLEATHREMLRREEMKFAQEQFAKNEFALAYKKAVGIVDSVYEDEARALAAEIDGVVTARLQKIRAPATPLQLKEALDLLVMAESIRPQRSDTAGLSEKLNKTATRFGGRAPPPPQQNDERKERIAEPPRPGLSVAQRAVAQFGEGRIDEAIQILSTVHDNREATQARERMQKFRDLYAAANADYRAKKIDSALQQLIAAKTQESAITRSSSRLGEDINRKIADMYYVQGNQLLLGNRLSESFKSFSAALQNDPNHLQVRQKLGELDARAAELIAQAKVTRDRQTAKGLLQSAMQIVLPGSATYQKAKSQLDALP